MGEQISSKTALKLLSQKQDEELYSRDYNVYLEWSESFFEVGAAVEVSRETI